MRARTVRAALAQAAGAPVCVTHPRPGIVRLIVPVGPGAIERWADVLDIVTPCHAWGSLNATGTVALWAELEEPQ
ncbi:hypothetical protein [Kitasatospora sp. A2-31]|uniref:hypothetical protein n=1 Tax=Kitasatospora sp. A2-31 TaxID=2916414 RepID=UPI001EEE73CC|nr:hypothetical protein [Kitasatospora sp. A2-31]MCG6498887.1 hypothetical protein [Kitasatospora sp. A2-31]MCG6499478.1 hypothetical protein [Kitasatospora sp. A2-31]MCG6500200.1 hypothetical protein [Kitasatospora sp. A2-31]